MTSLGSAGSQAVTVMGSVLPPSSALSWAAVSEPVSAERAPSPGARQRVSPSPTWPRAVTALPTAPPFGAGASPWVNQAALAIHLGRPGELRRLAGEMERVGQDVEAGLLCNYALLLERSQVSRKLILAEVTRMLEAAALARAPVSPSRAQDASQGVAPPGGSGAPSAEEVNPAPESSRPLSPIPILSVGNGGGGYNK
jgi:hypothetical protein